MSHSFREFLESRLSSGGFTTDDAIRVFVPLARQVLAVHQLGQVAPLQGCNALRESDGVLSFDPAASLAPTSNLAQVELFERPWRAAVEIVGNRSTVDDLDQGRHTQHSLDVAVSPSDELARPQYLPGYVVWEQRIEHHDPLSDMHLLGLILASLACGIDLHDSTSMVEWVQNRRNPFGRWPALHPVLAQTIFRLTELDRQRRERDLAGVIASLENYRDQAVDLEFDLSSLPGFRTADVTGKRQAILQRLRERLFDLSRRNRLLHDEAGSMQSLDLTQASVPLSFRPTEISPDRIWTWNDSLRQQLVSGKRISLGKHLNFAEAVYLPALLDRTAAETRRDLAEYGFEQLRLVVCWLHWSDLKSSGRESFRSPLVLIPVRLHKKKGVRDTYELEGTSDEAEINPVIRHRFSQLYGIRLPEAIDLSETDLSALHDFLSLAIRKSEPAVTLQVVDRPRMEIIHARARRKLEMYRRRARVSGRGIRSFADVSYSYDPMTYRPAGWELFRSFVKPTRTRLDQIIGAPNRKLERFVPSENSPAASDSSTLETQRAFAAMQSGGETNPYLWSFDLCALTLANFRYRRMSLVRDYDALLERPVEHAVFDAAFSNEPPSAIEPTLEPPAIDDRFDILPCDPTQATAIARARTGASYIVQGPPGTGKSQTIANLIADFVGREKRVLFVCEKRAAIDVVHARLRQRGIGHLACLIHDSQTDKRAFIEDLRVSFERLKDVATANAGSSGAAGRMQRDLEPLLAFDEAMRRAEVTEGVACRERIGDRLELGARLAVAGRALPSLDLWQTEALPDLVRWRNDRESMRRLFDWLARLAPGRHLAEHPLRWLSPKLAEASQPLERISQGLKSCVPMLEALRNAWQLSGWSISATATWGELLQALRGLMVCTPLNHVALFALIDRESAEAKKWEQTRRELVPLEQQVAARQEVCAHWIERLSLSETEVALAEARRFENVWWKWFAPAWWRLRKVLEKRYRFSAHAIRPSDVLILERLMEEHRAVAELTQAERRWLDPLQWRGSLLELDAALENARQMQRSATPEQSAWFQSTVASGRAAERLTALADACTLMDRFQQATEGWIDEVDSLPVIELCSALPSLESELGRLGEFLEPLRQLGQIDPQVRRALRRLPYGPEPLETAILDRSIQRTLRSDPHAATFDGQVRDGYQKRLEESYSEWLEDNARRLESTVATGFRKRLNESAAVGKGKDAAQETLRFWGEGLKILQNEFRKTMRHKAIRDLVSAASGAVVKDLKPIWLMSPLSVSDALPLDPELFDVVIFDEASQITLEEAVPTLFRARQSIVVGDEKQMPPTRFFASTRKTESLTDEETELNDDESDDESEGDDALSMGLEESSFLAHAARVLPSTLLGWHYRSRSESLISFSNWSFYGGRLLTAPEESPPRTDLPEIRVTDLSAAADQVDGLLSRAISYHRVAGVYDRRKNRFEAEYIAELIRELLKRKTGKTIGVVAFSEAQQSEIESALDQLAQENREFREQLEAERDREDDGQFCGLLVKNLENIQGDERDLMILSVCYAANTTGRMLMNFGPINQSGGEKRLNVAFSRAKQHMAIVASIEGEAITNTFNPGAAAFRNYLCYAAAISRGDTEGAERVLRGTVTETRVKEAIDPWNRSLAEAMAQWLVGEGFVVDLQVGQSRFVVDLAIRRPEDRAYRLGILLDGRAYYERRDLLEREMMRPKLLVDFGWRIMMVLGKDWWSDREEVQRRVLEQLATPLPSEGE